jgi:YaiO family outer membrane protein
LKKAKILLAMGKENEARAILALLYNNNPNSYEVNAILNSLKKYSNQINIDHTFDFFRVPYIQRWHMTSMQYQLNSKYGVFIGKLNLGQLVQDGEHYLSNPNEQLEIEAYPVINPTLYLYADYGYSWCKFFPLHRFGFEPFKILENNWEISGGFRFLVIKQSPSFLYIPIITGSVGKYFDSNWFSFRPFITFSQNNETSLSTFFFYRHYLGIAVNYIGGMIGYGVSPDEKYNDSGVFEHFNSDSYHLRFDIQHRITKRFLFRFMSEYIYEAYLSNIYRFEFVNDLYLSYQF